ncbi:MULTISPECIES: transposase [unclassified Streptomyces]|uniref:transposase n=1 Tax=unclassified Streptomyces TaxID=2593676 RepID=UPI002E80555A|nr:transposase [Streptomyces sp. NBC_00562]WTC77997.1 transposase [Streptomyces sp. NBC_01653]WTD92865.1 transposase [Streptomyces sp. NBC_01637]WUC23932.1 transposase [Streptomyces sp. NBC_00562]
MLSIDERTAIQARERRYPSQPARPGRRARREFEYRRHGTVSIVAALDVTTGQTLIETIDRNNAATFTAFLDRLALATRQGHPRRSRQRLLPHREAHLGLAGRSPALAHPLDPAPRVMTQSSRAPLLRADPRRPAARQLHQPNRHDREHARPFRWTYDGTLLKEIA